MYTLDLIKYISIRPKNRKVISIITLPIAISAPLDYHTYYYDIINEKHFLFLNESIRPANNIFAPICINGSITGRSIKCDIRTIFGETYKGRVMWLFNTNTDLKISRKVVLDVTSNEAMGYKHNYYLRTKNSNKRFRMMEL